MIKDLRITSLKPKGIRFPTSKSIDRSDAVNKDPDYSAAYDVIKISNRQFEGHGLTFTVGRGNKLCVEAIICGGFYVPVRKNVAG